MCLRISGLADNCGGVVYLEETKQCLFANLDGLGGSRPMGNGPFGEQDMFMRAGEEESRAVFLLKKKIRLC